MNKSNWQIILVIVVLAIFSSSCEQSEYALSMGAIYPDEQRGGTDEDKIQNPKGSTVNPTRIPSKTGIQTPRGTITERTRGTTPKNPGSPNSPTNPDTNPSPPGFDPVPPGGSDLTCQYQGEILALNEERTRVRYEKRHVISPEECTPVTQTNLCLQGSMTGWSSHEIYTTCETHFISKLITDNYRIGDLSNQTLDIVFVVDNSFSMTDDLATLAENISDLVNFFKEDSKTSPRDFNIGVTTTDPRQGASYEYSSVPIKGYDFYDRGYYAVESHLIPGTNYAQSLNLNSGLSEELFRKRFEGLFSIGSGIEYSLSFGSGHEKSFQALESFLNINSDDFIRDKSNLLVVFCTDEEEQSKVSASEISEKLEEIRKEKSLKTISVATFLDLQKDTSSFEELGRLIDRHSIMSLDQIAVGLSDIGKETRILLDSFVLSQLIFDVTTLEVRLNGVLLLRGRDYTFQARSRTIRLSDFLAYNEDDLIQIQYSGYV